MLKNLFRKKEYIQVKPRDLEDDKNTLPNIPEGKWIRCDKCKNIIYKDDLNSNYNV
ncbi:MAG: acetyl-CoA carboxylase carboxyl transferase subunit beta, partial [Romboutsia sp.]|nr:acetyl-CoA carboxylase carboxyl transferase subunit beta [Romboutsia sp.]